MKADPKLFVSAHTLRGKQVIRIYVRGSYVDVSVDLADEFALAIQRTVRLARGI